MNEPLSFFVPGIPVTQGSMKAFMRPGMKFPIVTHDKKPELNSWRTAIAGIAYNAAHRDGFAKIEEGAIHIRTEFFIPRPLSLPKKAVMPVKKPDGDKLLRAVKDALRGVLYRDDSQITDWTGSKRYAVNGQECGCRITIRPTEFLQFNHQPKQETP